MAANGDTEQLEEQDFSFNEVGENENESFDIKTEAEENVDDSLDATEDGVVEDPVSCQK